MPPKKKKPKPKQKQKQKQSQKVVVNINAPKRTIVRQQRSPPSVTTQVRYITTPDQPRDGLNVNVVANRRELGTVMERSGQRVGQAVHMGSQTTPEPMSMGSQTSARPIPTQTPRPRDRPRGTQTPRARARPMETQTPVDPPPTSTPIPTQTPPTPIPTQTPPTSTPIPTQTPLPTQTPQQREQRFRQQTSRTHQAIDELLGLTGTREATPEGLFSSDAESSGLHTPRTGRSPPPFVYPPPGVRPTFSFHTDRTAEDEPEPSRGRSRTSRRPPDEPEPEPRRGRSTTRRQGVTFI